MTDPTNRDPAELWVVLHVSKTAGKTYPTGVHLVRRDALDDAREPEDTPVTREHVTCYVPKSELELRDRRNEAERAHLEEAARILRMPTGEEEDRTLRAMAIVRWQDRDERKRREATK